MTHSLTLIVMTDDMLESGGPVPCRPILGRFAIWVSAKQPCQSSCSAHSSPLVPPPPLKVLTQQRHYQERQAQAQRIQQQAYHEQVRQVTKIKFDITSVLSQSGQKSFFFN